MRTQSPSACTVLRPDAQGNLVQVDVQRPAHKLATVRRGPFAVWDDQCQATRAGGTLAACAEYVCTGDYDGSRDEIVFVGANGLAPINSAERAELRRLVQEGSE